jgi:hypothetical protein
MSNSKLVVSRRVLKLFLSVLCTTLTLVACGHGGTPSKERQILPTTQIAQNPPSSTVTVTLWADQLSISSGATTVIHWSSNGTTCNSSGGGGSGASGSFTTPALFMAAPFTVTCTGADGSSTSQTLTVYVNSGCVNSETGESGVFTLINATSRVTGVAPLSVFFDASGTKAKYTTLPFHELEYQWEFGDKTGAVLNLSPPLTGTSTWNTGSRASVSNRDLATGPVTAHVFETPGTYFVTLNVTDGTNSVSNSYQNHR